MANTLTEVTPKLLAQGLLALRENSITARMVNRGYEALAGQKGSTIDVPIPSSIAVQEVSPSNVPPSTGDIAPTSVSIPLDQWWEAPFYLTDRDLLTAMDGTIPMQASEAIKSIINKVDTYILGLYTKIYGFYEELDGSSAMETPFTNGKTTSATQIGKILNNQLCPVNDRNVIMNADVEAAAKDVRAFQDASWRGTVDVIQAGRLNETLGYQWWMNQNVVTHTAGTLGTDGTVKSATAAGVTSVTLTNGNVAARTLKEGDIITFAGSSQTYAVQADVSFAASGDAAVTILPALQAAAAASAAVKVKGSHAVNLAMHRDCIAFATRPLEADTGGLGVITQSAVDPISGLALRLEITREHKRTRYSFDMLWGGAVVRPEFGARLASPA